MEIINLIFDIFNSPIPWLVGIPFLFGYAWVDKVGGKKILAQHINDLQDNKLDNDGDQVDGYLFIKCDMLENLYLNCRTIPTRTVNLLKIRVTVDGNMPTGEIQADGNNTTGNVNIIDIEADVEAGGLISGAKFTGLSLGIDGHGDDEADSNIYGIELYNNSVATPSDMRAFRIYGTWNWGIWIAGTHNSGIMFTGNFADGAIDFSGTASPIRIKHSGGVLVKSGTGMVEHEYNGGTNEFRLDGDDPKQITFYNDASKEGRLLSVPASSYVGFICELPNWSFRLYTRPGAGGIQERLRVDGDGIFHYKRAGDLMMWTYQGDVDDEASFNLPAITDSAHGWISAGDNEEYTLFFIDNDGDVTLISESGNVVANANTDAKLCIGTAGAQEPLAIKNRLGATKNINLVVWYS